MARDADASRALVSVVKRQFLQNLRIGVLDGHDARPSEITWHILTADLTPRHALATDLTLSLAVALALSDFRFRHLLLP